MDGESDMHADPAMHYASMHVLALSERNCSLYLGFNKCWFCNMQVPMSISEHNNSVDHLSEFLLKHLFPVYYLVGLQFSTLSVVIIG
jgi:hypothetical protein